MRRRALIPQEQQAAQFGPEFGHFRAAGTHAPARGGTCTFTERRAQMGAVAVAFRVARDATPGRRCAAADDGAIPGGPADRRAVRVV